MAHAVIPLRGGGYSDATRIAPRLALVTMLA
jgi:hypothetical protein